MSDNSPVKSAFQIFLNMSEDQKAGAIDFLESLVAAANNQVPVAQCPDICLPHGTEHTIRVQTGTKAGM